MEYRERRLGPPLDLFVECAWFLSTRSSDTLAQPRQTILPDGCIEVIFHLGGRFRAVSDGAPEHDQPVAFVAGLLTRPLHVAAVPGADSVGVRFRPGAAYPFFRTALTHLTNLITPLDDLWDDAQAISGRLSAAGDDRDRAAILSDALAARLRRAELHAPVASAVHDLLRTAGRTRVAPLAGRAGFTPRQLQRQFAARVGVPPKTLARILRFQNTLRHRAHAGGAPDWLRVAIECGYTDQSHLIRDYAEFAGDTPVGLREAEGELSAYFTAPQRLAALFDARR